jgi:hypothetical protein
MLFGKKVLLISAVLSEEILNFTFVSGSWQQIFLYQKQLC